MNTKAKWGIGLLILVSGTAFGFYWPFGRSENVLRLPGTVEIQEVRLSSKVGGRVAKVVAREGEVVKPGQAIVVLELPELAAQREQAQARLEAAEAVLLKANNGPRQQEKDAAWAAAKAAEERWNRIKAGNRPEEIENSKKTLASLNAELEGAQKILVRQRALVPSNATSQADVDAAESSVLRLEALVNAATARYDMMKKGSRDEEIKEAEAEFKRMEAQAKLLDLGTRCEEKAEARARVAELKARVRELDILLAEATIVAPEAAVIEVIAVRPGDVVAANQPVARVLRTDDLWVKAYVTEVDLGKVPLNQTVELKVDAYPGKKFQGVVAYISPVSEFTPRNVQSVDERRHQVFALKIRVDDPRGVFKSGMAADVFLPLSQ